MTHSGTATTRPGTVTIYSDSYNLTLANRDGGAEGGWEGMLLNALFFSLFLVNAGLCWLAQLCVLLRYESFVRKPG